MSTDTPVLIPDDGQWVVVLSGTEFSGAIQNVSHSPLVGIVHTPTVDNPQPAQGAGGFAICSQPIPILIGESESLFARSAGGIGSVVLA